MKNKREIKWLQLSDLHLFKGTDWNIMRDGYEELSKVIEPDFIVITGDYRHLRYEYNQDYSKTVDFLDWLSKVFSVSKDSIFLIPGNHDVNKEISEERKKMIEDIVTESSRNADAYLKYLEGTTTLYDYFSEYTSFVKKFYSEESLDGKRVTAPFEVDHYVWNNCLNLIVLNTALISDGRRDHGEIVDIYSLSELKLGNDYPTIVLGHHDYSSFIPEHQSRLIPLFKRLNVKAYLCGDTHKEDIQIIDKYYLSDKIPCIICGKSAVEPGDDYSDVGVIEYTWREDGEVYVIPYRWGKVAGDLRFKKADDFIININEDYRFPFGVMNGNVIITDEGVSKFSGEKDEDKIPLIQRKKRVAYLDSTRLFNHGSSFDENVKSMRLDNTGRRSHL